MSKEGRGVTQWQVRAVNTVLLKRGPLTRKEIAADEYIDFGEQQVFNVLKVLKAENHIIYEREGHSHEYRVNFKNPISDDHLDQFYTDEELRSQRREYLSNSD